jgi:hypothetical protein
MVSCRTRQLHPRTIVISTGALASETVEATLVPVLRCAHLAFALVLLLTVAPLAGATCGITCLAASPHTTRSAIAQQRCVSAAACCHSRGSAICAAAQAPEALAALLSINNEAPDASAVTVPHADISSPNAAGLTTRRIDSSPPGQLRITPNPLRI